MPLLAKIVTAMCSTGQEIQKSDVILSVPVVLLHIFMQWIQVNVPREEIMKNKFCALEKLELMNNFYLIYSFYILLIAMNLTEETFQKT